MQLDRRQLFLIQILYAIKWSSVMEIPFEEALLRRTHLYKHFLGESEVQQRHPIWLWMVEQLKKSGAEEGATWLQYLEWSKVLASIKSQGPKKNFSRFFGPFRYTYDSEKQEALLHLSIKEKEMGALVLKKGKESLKNLLTELKTVHPEATHLTAEAWTLSHHFWRRMAPKEFMEALRNFSLEEFRAGLTEEIVWGQFLDKRGKPMRGRIESFLKKLSEAKSQEELLHCFPIWPKKVKISLEYITYYGIYL